MKYIFLVIHMKTHIKLFRNTLSYIQLVRSWNITFEMGINIEKLKNRIKLN